MHLNFEHFDGRGWNDRDVIDEYTGNKVGYIRSHGVGFSNNGGITISLFDDKYRTIVNSYKECRGFVLGVQTVLNRMTSVDDGRRRLENELDQAREKLRAVVE